MLLNESEQFDARAGSPDSGETSQKGTDNIGHVGRLFSNVGVTGKRAMPMFHGTATVRLVTRQPVDNVEQAVEDVGGEVSELIGSPAGLATNYTFGKLLGSKEKALLPSIGSPGNGSGYKLAASCEGVGAVELRLWDRTEYL